MKLNLIILALISFLGLTACSSQNPKVTARENASEPQKEIVSAKNRTPVLVELFTSEG